MRFDAAEVADLQNCRGAIWHGGAVVNRNFGGKILDAPAIINRRFPGPTLYRSIGATRIESKVYSREKAIDQGGDFDADEGARARNVRAGLSRLSLQNTDRFNEVDVTGATPSDELDRIDPALTCLDFPGVAVGFVQLCGE